MRRKPLSYYLGLKYPFRVHVTPEGDYFADFPDLDGVMTDAESIDGLPAMIEEARSLWLESEYEDGRSIPEPTIWDYENEYSGRFNLRIPKALHRSLADAAEQDGVSLNQYVVSLLARGEAQARIEARLDALEATLRREPARGTMIADEGASYEPRAPRKKPPARRKRTT